MTASFELGWARHMTGVAHLHVIMIRHFQLRLYNMLRRALRQYVLAGDESAGNLLPANASKRE
jgi:hypothetical protein